MSEQDFDAALIAAAFTLAAERGWARFSLADAARASGLSLAETRSRFPSKRALLARFGVLLDRAALAASPDEAPVRDRLFDLLMGRFDAMKPHRLGLRALGRHLPCDPALALYLACSTRRSMAWMLSAAGVETSGLRGALRVRGLIAVWLWGVRAFDGDESEDLSATMAAVDTALGRADEAAGWIAGRARGTADDVSAEDAAGG